MASKKATESRKTTRSTGSTGDLLPEALACGRDQQLGEAVSKLLSAWSARPGPRLASVISTISGHARSATPPGLRGKKATAVTAWTDFATKATTLDIPALLESLTDVDSGEAKERMALIEAWPADPRIDDALVGWLEGVPYRATSTRPFWRAVLTRARQLRDPRLIPRLDAAAASYATNIAATMAEWLIAELAKLRKALESEWAAVEADDPVLLELESWAASLSGARRVETKNADELLAAIHASPDDDALRAVYADALVERGDPRGEFIAVQCRMAKEGGDASMRRKEKELLEAHGKGWLGPLAPVVMSGYKFERGFLASCRVNPKKMDLVRALVGHADWSTVRDIGGPSVITLDPVMRGMRSLAFDFGAETEQAPDSWRNLLVDQERALEELEYRGLRRGTPEQIGAELEALCACRALPRLQSLVVCAPANMLPGAIADAPVLARLKALEFRMDTRRRPVLVPFAELLTRPRVPTLRFTFSHSEYHPTELCFTGDAEGYRTFEMKLGPVGATRGWSEELATEGVGIVAALPKTIREVRIKLKSFDEPDRARVTTAVSALGDLTVCQIT